jgi:protein-disulfide isomerase-like protein with CxxC motif
MAHDKTIEKSLSNQKFSQSALDQIFNQNDLDYPQEPEVLFVLDNSDLIAVSADDKFQILSQVEMANRHVPKLVMCKN